jgi:hypothetical protein
MKQVAAIRRGTLQRGLTVLERAGVQLQPRDLPVPLMRPFAPRDQLVLVLDHQQPDEDEQHNGEPEQNDALDLSAPEALLEGSDCLIDLRHHGTHTVTGPDAD